MTDAQEPQPVIVVGRSLIDYKRSRAKIEPGFRIFPCKSCGTETVLSPDGAATINAHRESVILCNPCAYALAALRPDAQLVMSKHAAEQVEHSDAAKRTLSQFLDRLGKG